MSGFRSLTSLEASEYDRIEAAMRESDRGRWFLAEHALRNRSADTDVLLAAIGRLESAVTGDRETGRFGRMRGDLTDMAQAIARTKAEIGAIATPAHDGSRLGVASAALDGIVRSTERATSDILTAAEHVQEAAWTLREAGAEPAACDILDRRATEIYTACSFQDLTAQRIARIVHTLRYLEDRITAMIAIWGDDRDAVPAGPDDGSAARPEARRVAEADLSQTDVDRFIDMAAPPGAAPARPAPLPDIGAQDEDILFLPGETGAAGDPAGPDLPQTAASPVDATRNDAPAADEARPGAAPAEAAAVGPDATDAEAIDAGAPGPAWPEAEKADIAAAFADIDRLSDEEKQALFS